MERIVIPQPCDLCLEAEKYKETEKNKAQMRKVLEELREKKGAVAERTDERQAEREHEAAATLPEK